MALNNIYNVEFIGNQIMYVVVRPKHICHATTASLAFEISVLKTKLHQFVLGRRPQLDVK